jgi:hypothetical protein
MRDLRRHVPEQKGVGAILLSKVPDDSPRADPRVIVHLRLSCSRSSDGKAARDASTTSASGAFSTAMMACVFRAARTPYAPAALELLRRPLVAAPELWAREIRRQEGNQFSRFRARVLDPDHRRKPPENRPRVSVVCPSQGPA